MAREMEKGFEGGNGDLEERKMESKNVINDEQFHILNLND
jgi:hypothetical protein